MVLALWGWLQRMEGVSAWIIGLGGVVIGGLVYALVLLLLRVDEIRSLIDMLCRRIKRPV
jgi:hypothetical protein